MKAYPKFLRLGISLASVGIEKDSNDIHEET